MRAGPRETSSMDGPSLDELISSGVKVDTLKQLLTKKKDDSSEVLSGDEGAPKKLIALDQVTVRGEDLTGEFEIIELEADSKCFAHLIL